MGGRSCQLGIFDKMEGGRAGKIHKKSRQRQEMGGGQPEEESIPEEESVPEEDDYPEGDPFAPEEEDEPTRRISLKDLKFGRNYSGERDE